MDRLRKSAILVTTLDPDVARALLDQLPGDQADQIRQTILELSNVDLIDERATIVEFLEANPASFEKSSHVRSSESERAPRVNSSRELFNRATPNRSIDQRLNSTPVEVLVRLLLNEMPQTIAAVLSQVTAAHAADVVSLLPADSHVEIMHRLVEIDQPSVFSCDIVRQELDRWMLESLNRDAERSELLHRLSGFVAEASETARIRLSATLAAEGSFENEFDSQSKTRSPNNVSEQLDDQPPAAKSTASVPARRIVWS